MMLRSPLQPILRPVLGAIGNRRPTALTISQLLPSGAGRVAAIYSDPARPSYDECIQKNMAAIAAGRPQDCVLFADAAGQTPVVYPIGAGQGKGLLLDRSAGLVRGPELVTNGGFDTDTDWTKGTGWTIGSGVATKAGGTGSTLTPSSALTPTVSKVYEVVYTITRTAGSVTVSIGAAAGAAKTASGTYTEKLLATTTDNLTISADAAFAGTIDNISVRELPGHHQQQPTAAARGEFSRRYNELTATEDFGNAFWIKTGTTVDQNTGDTLDPNGLNGAVKILPDTGTSAHKVTGNLTFSDTISRTYSIYLKSAGARYVRLARGASQSPVAVFDLVDVVSSGSSSSITDVGDGWRLCRLADGSGGTSGGFAVAIQNSYTTVEESYTGDGISGIYAWHPDLRLTADAIPSIPAYQRVTTASDYDEVGFPTYWRAQTDDWAKSHMNPNGATKSYVFWAGQKMSDAASGVVFETSPNSDSNNGALLLLAPGSAGADKYSALSKGTLATKAATTSVAYNAPHRAFLTAECSTAGDITRLTVNSDTPILNSFDQGTGAYLEYDVFFGARGGVSVFANIREYAPPTILFLQPADSLSASHLAKLQKGYAKAVGVTL